ncbi:MAG TPA: hypothetical protein VM238_18530 [Phycisphaerae bacterium]|nr:hypothetical protein [Phycisphaerae bacterium]
MGKLGDNLFVFDQLHHLEGAVRRGYEAEFARLPVPDTLTLEEVDELEKELLAHYVELSMANGTGWTDYPEQYARVRALAAMARKAVV